MFVLRSVGLPLRVHHLVLVVHQYRVILLLEPVVRSDTAWNGGRRLHSDTTSRVGLVAAAKLLTQLILILKVVSSMAVILYPLSAAAVCEIVMHDGSPLSLGLNTAGGRTMVSVVAVIDQLVAERFRALLLEASVDVLQTTSLIKLLDIMHVCSVERVAKVIRILPHLLVHTGAERIESSDHVVASA